MSLGSYEPADPSPHYATHGDPYADPPRARVCVTCGLLVGDEELHDAWHERADPRPVTREELATDVCVGCQHPPSAHHPFCTAYIGNGHSCRCPRYKDPRTKESRR